MTTRMYAGAHAEQRGIRLGWMLSAFVGALAIAVVFLGGRASAYDWTDADCSHWLGTPQYAECVQAHAHLAESDCGKWTPGEKEFVKCQHAHNVARVQECQRAAMRNSARAPGWDGVATMQCPPLVNEHTGVVEGEQPVQSEARIRRARPVLPTPSHDADATSAVMIEQRRSWSSLRFDELGRPR